MLNGIDPIIIFNFKKKLSASSESLPGFVGPRKPTIPIVAALDKITDFIDLPVVPIYLSENLTGIFIDTESKSIEIDTTIDTLSSGGTPEVNQRGIQSTVKIEMVAHASSVGLSLFAALSDLIFPKVTSKEYSVTYLHGAVTVFAGLLHSFSITQGSNDNLYHVSLELIKPSTQVKGLIPVVGKLTGALPL